MNGRPTSRLQPAAKPSDVHDLICVGFGPASLAIAVALHDTLEAAAAGSGQVSSPKVLFLEKQARFAWHAGMLLPGAKMQISFIKDMATLRNPQSRFTFLNYLHSQGRLVEFTNLSTFLPARIEYEEYMRWCAEHFDHVVQYGSEVLAVSPVEDTKAGDAGGGAVRVFEVISRDLSTGKIARQRATNVVLAVGGQPAIPQCLSLDHSRVIHSSQYAHLVPKLLPDRDRPYRVAVIGAGQSAAEIFNNIQVLYPNSRTWLVMRSEFLKPSDDSPFVNSIFNPDYVDNLYPRSYASRQNLLSDARSTNYGVVRLGLIEQLYERMYNQRRELGADEQVWPHRILGGYDIESVEASGPEGVRLHVRSETAGRTQVLDVDLVVAATGYKRDAHVEMLRGLWHLLPDVKEQSSAAIPLSDRWEVRPKGRDSSTTRTLEVTRDYRVQFSPGSIAAGSGIFLQGCCEGTHGPSDTLLSVLATRSGEIVESIFGGPGNTAAPGTSPLSSGIRVRARL